MKKGTILASVVFAVLLIGAAMSLNRKPERGITRLSFATVDKAGIDKLEISGPNPVELQKKDGKWVLANGKEADQTAVQNALDAIPKIDSSDIVTSNSERFAEYGVDEARGTKVVAWAGAKKVAEAIVGNAGGSGTFVRSGDAVYSVRGVSSYLFSKPVSSWMQLKIFTDAFDDVSRLEVALQGQTPYALVKKDNEWQLEDPSVAPAGFRFDKSQARTLVSSVVNLRAKEFVDSDPGAEATGLEQADVFAFVAKDGARRELKVGKAREDKSLFAHVAGRDDLFVVQEYTGRALRKALPDLREMTLMKFETEKATKLTIRDGKTELVFEKQGADWKIGRSTEVVPKDFELDAGAVLRRLNAVKNARALRIAPDDGSRGGGWRSSGSVTLTLEDGKNATLSFGGATKHEEQDAYFAIGNADGEIYLVTKYLHDDLLRGLQSFKKVAQQAPPQIDPKALEQLPPEVRKSLQEQITRQQQMQQLIEKAQESR